MRQPQNAVPHFQRVVEVDSHGEIGIEASKELIRLGVYTNSPGRVMPPPPTGAVAPPPGSIATSQGLLSGASFGLRVGASLIDSILLTVFTLMIVLPLAATGKTTLAWTFNILCSFAYFAGMEASPLQGTLGKRAMGLRVCKLNGERLDLLTASLKHFLRILTTLSPYLCIGIFGWLMVAFSKRKQAFYEFATGTVTVHGKPSEVPMGGSPRYSFACPKCGSPNVETSKRGWTLATGLIGSNKPVLRCTQCGHKFEPGG